MDLEKRTIREDRTFSNFMIGESNNDAYQAALHRVTQFGKKNNWLWIYSDSGLGNTHLLHAIGNQLCEQQRNLQIKQIHLENFCLKLLESRKKGELDQLIENYSDFDCLLLDGMTLLMSTPAVVNTDLKPTQKRNYTSYYQD